MFGFDFAQIGELIPKLEPMIKGAIQDIENRQNTTIEMLEEIKEQNEKILYNQSLILNGVTSEDVNPTGE